MALQKKNTAKKENKDKTFLYLLLVVLIVFAAHFRSVYNGFTNWDDPQYVINNELIKNFSAENLKAMFTEFRFGHYHPLTWLSLATDCYLFGNEPAGYHSVNLLLHLLNVILVFLFISGLTGDKRLGLLSALFFGITPLSVESVAWVTERKNLLYTFFFLISLICYLKYTVRNMLAFLLLSVISFCFSLFSKSMAITLPLVLILIDYFKGRNLLSQNVIAEKLPYLFLAFAFGVISIYAQSGVAGFDTVHLQPGLKIIYGTWALLKYSLLIFIPVNLSAFYPIYLNDLPAHYYLGIIFSVLIIWIIYKGIKKDNRFFVFGILFYIVNIFLLLKFFDIPYGSFYMADRYTYVAAIGIYFIISWFIIKGIRSGLLRKAIVTAIVLLFGISCYNRTVVWKSSLSLWNDVLKKYPGSHVALLNRGNALKDMKRYEEALSDYNRIIKDSPGYNLALANRGYVYYVTGKYCEALADFNTLLEINPNDRNALTNRLLCLQKTGRQDITDEIEKQVESGNETAEMLNILGNTEFEKGNFHKAVKFYTKAINKDSLNILYRYNRANSKSKAGLFSDAAVDYEIVIAKEKNNPDYYFNRGTNYYFLRMFAEAKSDMDMAIKLNPHNAGFYLNRSNVMLALGKPSGALNDVSRAITLDSTNAENYARRAMIYFSMNNMAMGCSDAKKALSLGFPGASELIEKYCR